VLLDLRPYDSADLIETEEDILHYLEATMEGWTLDLSPAPLVTSLVHKA
jgi:DNA-binding phage protein